MNEAKPWYKSLTIIINVLVIAATVLLDMAHILPLDPEVQVAIVGICNIILRFRTDKPVKVSASSGGTVAALVLALSLTACTGQIGVTYDGEKWQTQMNGYIDWQEAIARASSDPALKAQAPGVAQAMRYLAAEKP